MGFTLSPEGFKYILHTASCRQSLDSGPDAQLSFAPTTHHKEPHVPLPGIVRDRGLAMGEDLLK